MAKYAALKDYLSEQTDARVTLSFDDIEHIIGDTLPASAHKFRQWWGNKTNSIHVEAHAWMSAGWKVDWVSLDEERVVFARE